MSITHNLKIAAHDFDAIQRGDKTFLVCRDMGFQKTHIVRLTRHRGPGAENIDPLAPRLELEISHVQSGHLGLLPGYAALGLVFLGEEERAAA